MAMAGSRARRSWVVLVRTFLLSLDLAKDRFDVGEFALPQDQDRSTVQLRTVGSSENPLRGIQLAANGQHRVANALGFQPSQVLPPEQVIAGIDSDGPRIVRSRRQAVRAGRA